MKGDPVGLRDPDRLGQAICNLVGNALEHAAPNVPLEVSIERAGAAV